MEIPVYLAMTAAEFRTCSVLPPHPAWLSCLFSPYGRGLSNIPKQLPADSLLILSDRTPPYGHDPELILETLSETISRLSCNGLLLDFERPDNTELLEIAKMLTVLPYPVAVSASYAHNLDCPVFVPPLPPTEPLGSYLTPWKGREIWLELSTQGQTVTVTESGATFKTCTPPPPLPHKDNDLFCHYALECNDNAAIFTVHRTTADLNELLSAHPTLGITRAVGLCQEFQ